MKTLLVLLSITYFSFSQNVDSLLNLGNYSEARQVLNANLAQALNKNDTLVILLTKRKFAKLNYMLGNFDQVIQHISSVLEIAKKKKLDKYISDSYTYLAIVYDSQGRFEQSIVYMHLATDLYKRNHLTKRFSSCIQ